VQETLLSVTVSVAVTNLISVPDIDDESFPVADTDHECIAVAIGLVVGGIFVIQPISFADYIIDDVEPISVPNAALLPHECVPITHHDHARGSVHIPRDDGRGVDRGFDIRAAASERLPT
jgi:hypothetical protein